MLSRSNSPGVISTLCVMFMAIDVCFLHESKYVYGSTKAGYLGEARSRRVRRCSLDAYVECAHYSRAGWWHSNASCCKWAVDDLTKQQSTHTMGSVSFAHVQQTVCRDALFRSIAKLLIVMQRDTAVLDQHARVVFKMGADNSSSSQSPCSDR